MLFWQHFYRKGAGKHLNLSEEKWKKSGYPIPSISDLARVLVSSKEQPVQEEKIGQGIARKPKKQYKDEAEKDSEITRTL